MRSRSLVAAGVTHSAALLIGWGGWTVFRQAGKVDGPAAAVATKGRERPAGAAKSTDEILAIISSKGAGEPQEQPDVRWEARADKTLADFNELVRTMSAPDDPQAAVEAEMKQWSEGEPVSSAKLAALLYFWSEKDFAGLMKWAERGDERKTMALAYHMRLIVQKTIEEKGAKPLFKLPKDVIWTHNLMVYAGEVVGKSGDPTQLAGAKALLDPKHWREFMGNVASNWPWEGRSKLMELAISENEPGMLVRLGRLRDTNPAEQSAWLLEVIHDETLDAEFREKLAKDGSLKRLANVDPKMPMATRVALLQGSDPAAPPEQDLYNRLATNDVRNILRERQDWSYGFRHGTMEADEVLAAFSTQFPDQAAKAPDAVRDTVFKELIEEDSGRAVDLLKNLPQDERTTALLDAAKAVFFGVDPNRFLEVLRQVPPDNPELWDARLDAWVKHGPDNYNRLDAGYVDWVRALPKGLDRDMALYSLAMASQGRDPSLASDLRGEVQDAKLKQRIGGAQ